MNGLGLDNMLGAEEVERLFSENPNETDSSEAEASSGGESQEQEQETAEVDFSSLIGEEQPESVGSGETSEEKGKVPTSNGDEGAPEDPLFFSIAKALRDEGVFPDTSDDELSNIKDAASFRKLFEDQVSKSLNERQLRIEKALNGGADSNEVRAYQNDLSVLEFLEAQETFKRLTDESDEGQTLRKQVMYQDYMNRGISEERAKKMVQRSFDDGSDIEDAKEAFAACKEFYQKKVEEYQSGIEQRNEARRKQEEKEFNDLKKQLVDTDTFFGGVKVDKSARQKAYELLTKPVHKDESGQILTALQKYQREHPQDFLKNVALMFSLTDGFTNVERLTKAKVSAGIKKGFEELKSQLNNTRRNSDGTLNFANTAPPDNHERENWTLAV